MTVAPEAEIAVVNRYRLLSGREPFLAASLALAGRVEAEGHPGILSYRLYAPEGVEEARLVARYRDAEAWVGHHDLAMGWPEMAAFRTVAALERVELYGAVTDAMRDWIDRIGLAERIWFSGPQRAGFGR
jgi:Antibiotic biosynthesis monooxygenase